MTKIYLFSILWQAWVPVQGNDVSEEPVLLDVRPNLVCFPDASRAVFGQAVKKEAIIARPREARDAQGNENVGGVCLISEGDHLIGKGEWMKKIAEAVSLGKDLEDDGVVADDEGFHGAADELGVGGGTHGRDAGACVEGGQA